MGRTASEDVGLGETTTRARERLADLQLLLLAQEVAEVHRGLGERHLRFERGVARGGVGTRKFAEMHGLGHVRSAQIAVDRLGDEGGEGRGDLRQLHQHVAQRAVRLQLVRVVLGLPEAAAAAADVPVGQVLDEGDERAHGALEVVAVSRR